jgi:hypothetical protein
MPVEVVRVGVLPVSLHDREQSGISHAEKAKSEYERQYLAVGC